MAQEIDKIFQQYLADISTTMIDDKSTYTKQTKVIEEQFLRYGLTNEQLAQIISEINGKAMQFITQYANASALELVKLNENRPLLAAQIALAEKELELKEKDLELKEKDLALKDKELALKDRQIEMQEKDIALKEQQLLIQQEELKIKQQELILKQEQLKEMTAKIALIEAQTTSEASKNKVLIADEKTKTAQTKNLGAEFDVIVEKKNTQIQETAVKRAQAAEIDAKKLLIDAQKITEGKQQILLGSQSTLVLRQVAGYDDNRRVKKSEHLSNLAGFAVNSGADGADAMVSNATHAANAI